MTSSPTVQSVVLTGSAAISTRYDNPGSMVFPFDVKAQLGKKGTRYLTPSTQHLAAASAIATGTTPAEPENPMSLKPERSGVVVGTNYADHEVRKEVDETLLTKGYPAISPMSAANTSVNIPASYLGIRQRLQAFNITITTPETAGLEALLTARTQLVNQQADKVVVGATDPVVSSDPHARDNHLDAVALVLERPREAAAAEGPEILGGFSLFIPPRFLETTTGARRAVERYKGLYEALVNEAYGAEPFSVRVRSANPGLCDLLNRHIHLNQNVRNKPLGANVIEIAGFVSCATSLFDTVTMTTGLVVAIGATGHIATVAVRNQHHKN